MFPKEKKRQWVEEDTAKAIHAVKEKKKMDTLKASKTFKVPRGTLPDHSKTVNMSPSILVTIN